MFSIEIKGLEELKNGFKKSPEIVGAILEKSTLEAGGKILLTEKEEAPVKTSNLRRKIEMEYKPIQVSITPKTKYAEFVVFGTKPHIILPKSIGYKGHKGGLYWKGQLHSWNKVSHPGTKKNNFVERTINKVEGDVNKIFEKAQQEIIDKI
jgi:HK97 gp10 family phage protein